MSVKENYKILIADDETEFHQKIRLAFRRDFEFEGATSEEEVLDKIESDRFDVILLDLDLVGDKDYQRGLRFIKPLRDKVPYTPIVVATKDGKVQTAVEAMEQGASSFFYKMEYNHEFWKGKLVEVIEQTRLKKKEETLQATLDNLQKVTSSRHAFISVSERVNEIKQELAALSSYPNTTVLLLGETGVGKEVAARYLHRRGNRKNQPFIPVNLSVVQPDRMESALFGHKKGAYTDAKSDHVGYFQRADKGVLFLDEIGDIDLKTQVKILRFLDDKTIVPMGGTEELELDVQIVTATNKKLKEEVEKGRFREDLYHRLSNYVIHIPSLRERQEDIRPIAEHFMSGQAIDEVLLSDVTKRLFSYPWPGNIRELRNTVESMLLKASIKGKEKVGLDCLPLELREFEKQAPLYDIPDELQGDLEWQKAALELRRIQDALKNSGGRKKTAAESLQMKPDDLLYRVKKYYKKYPQQLKLHFQTLLEKYKLPA